jgi:hypothetical protein
VYAKQHKPEYMQIMIPGSLILPANRRKRVSNKSATNDMLGAFSAVVAMRLVIVKRMLLFIRL